MEVDYSSIFQKLWFWSIDLQDRDRLADLRTRGYTWIRRDDSRRFNQVLRQPTIGCYVEVFKTQYPGCVPIQSWEGRKMIRKLCYF